MAIFITGDTHGDFSRLLPAAFHEQRDLTKEDYLIICGDVSTFYLSKFFTSSGINLCPGSRIAFPTTLCHCVDAGYAQDKNRRKQT